MSRLHKINNIQKVIQRMIIYYYAAIFKTLFPNKMDIECYFYISILNYGLYNPSILNI